MNNMAGEGTQFNQSSPLINGDPAWDGKYNGILTTGTPRCCSGFRTTIYTCAFRCSPRSTGCSSWAPLFPISRVPVPLWYLSKHSVIFLPGRYTLWPKKKRGARRVRRRVCHRQSYVETRHPSLRAFSAPHVRASSVIPRLAFIFDNSRVGVKTCVGCLTIFLQRRTWPGR